MNISKLCVASFFVTVLASAQLNAAELPQRILLWPNGAPGSEGKPVKETVRITDAGDQVVSNIHQPCVFPCLPSADRATGTAVIIAPGGGHRELWLTHEGHNLAKWLSDRGVAAELHIYAKAGHGFGVRDSLKGAVAKWPERFIEWLDDMGMTKRE